MRRMILSCAVVSLCILFSLGSYPSLYVNCRASLLRLIANPKEFHEQVVSTRGYVVFAVDAVELYVDKNEYELGNELNSILLSIDHSEVVRLINEEYKSYCSVSGIFEYDFDIDSKKYIAVMGDVSFGGCQDESIRYKYRNRR